MPCLLQVVDWRSIGSSADAVMRLIMYDYDLVGTWGTVAPPFTRAHARTLTHAHIHLTLTLLPNPCGDAQP